MNRREVLFVEFCVPSNLSSIRVVGDGEQVVLNLPSKRSNRIHDEAGPPDTTGKGGVRVTTSTLVLRLVVDIRIKIRRKIRQIGDLPISLPYDARRNACNDRVVWDRFRHN